MPGLRRDAAALAPGLTPRQDRLESSLPGISSADPGYLHVHKSERLCFAKTGRAPAGRARYHVSTTSGSPVQPPSLSSLRPCAQPLQSRCAMAPEVWAVIIAGVSLGWQIVDHIQRARADRPRIELRPSGYGAGIEPDGLVRARMTLTLTNTGRTPGQVVAVTILVEPSSGRTAGEWRGRVLTAGGPRPSTRDGGDQWLAGPPLPFEVAPFQSVSLSVDLAYLDPPTACAGVFPVRVTTGDGKTVEGRLALPQPWVEDARVMSAERRAGKQRRVDVRDRGESRVLHLRADTPIDLLPESDDGPTALPARLP